MNEELMKELKRSEHLLCKGLKEINDKGMMNGQTLEIIGKAADIALDMSKISKESEEGQFSRFYNDGYGRRRRDSMGRFTEGYGEGYNAYNAGEANTYAGYSRDGYGRDNYGRESYGAEPEREYLDWNLRQAASVLKDQNGR